MGADAPWCEFGQFKRSSTEGGFRKTVHRCRRIKDGSSAATQATTGSSSDAETEAGPSQQQERPSPCPNTLHRSSTSVLSPTPTVPGPRPTGYRWSGASSVSTDPIATRERQQAARAGRGVSTLQPSWLTDFKWLFREKDPDLTAQTAGRCRTESEDELVCRGCTQCSRLYCRERRNRTGSVFSAAIGSRTFKRAECVRHEELEACHRNERGSIRCRFGHGGAGLRRLKRWYALRCPLPSRRRSQESSAALYYVGYVSMTPGPLELEWEEPAPCPTRPVVGRKQAGRRRSPGVAEAGERKMRRSSGSLSGQILGL